MAAGAGHCGRENERYASEKDKGHPAMGFPVTFPYTLDFEQISLSFFYAPICVEIMEAMACQTTRVLLLVLLGHSLYMYSNLMHWIYVCNRKS